MPTNGKGPAGTGPQGPQRQSTTTAPLRKLDAQFIARDLVVIDKGNLLGSFDAEMSSGLIIPSLIFRQKQDPSAYSVAPKGFKTPSGFVPAVTFVSDERRAEWCRLALEAVLPSLQAALESIPVRSGGRRYASF